jgi:hypothetical protein
MASGSSSSSHGAGYLSLCFSIRSRFIRPIDSVIPTSSSLGFNIGIRAVLVLDLFGRKERETPAHPQKNPESNITERKGEKNSPGLSLWLAGKERRRLLPRLFRSIPVRIQWRLGEEEPWAV